nr:hypothetical protein [Tanacetum cinerariifolium]
MGYEHFSTTLVTELDEVAESSIKNLIPIPRKCEVTSEDESKCDMPVQDQSSSVFTIFSNPLFKDNDDLTSSDDESLSEEDVPIEEFKVFSNPLFDDDEINSDELEIFCELAHIDPDIPESDFDSGKEIHLIENLLYDNSSSQPPEEPNADEQRIRREHAEYISHMEMLFTISPRPRPMVNANTNVESIPSSLIPIQDNDSQREEIDIVTNTNDVLPPGVENDDDSDGEIDVVEELHVDKSISNAENELSDNEESDFDNPSVPLPLPKPPDADFEPDSEEEISVVINDIKDKFDVSFMFVSEFFFHFLSIPRCFFLLSMLRVRTPSLTPDLPLID